METFLRPLIFKQHMRRIYLFSRQFRAGRPSIGLGSTQRDNTKLKEFYQDTRMEQLFKSTLQRISSVQSRIKGQAYPASSSSSSNPASSASQASSSSSSSPPNQPSALLSDDQELMRLSFAEGYFRGQMHEKKFRLYRMVQTAYYVGMTVTVAFLFWYREAALNVSSKSSYEVKPGTLDVKFSDVKGCDEAKEELADIVEFLKNPSKFSRLGGKLPKGVLLVGPPGTGKTLLARATAREADVPFLLASGSEFDELLVGQGAKRIRDLFEQAKQRAPCLIFIDEIDSVGGKRSSSVLHPYANQTINQLLSELDGFNQNEDIIVMGATNRADDLDQALLRPGRFDIQVTVPKPDYKGRRDLFDHYLAKVEASLDIDIDMLCRSTIGFTGADIESLINQAALKSATENMDVVSQESLEFARDKILMGPERRTRLPDKEQNLMTAYHEGGHALVAYYTEKANSLHKVTIVSRGNTLGHTSTLPDRDSYTQTKEQLSAAMDVMLGGRVAEELIYGSDRVTTGCGDDLKKANMLATRMVKDFGMSEKIGMRVVREDKSESPAVLSKFSDATSELVESEINKLLEESKNRVRNLLTEHRKELKLLAEALLKYETLDAAEVKLVIEGKDPRVLFQEREKDRRRKSNNLIVKNPTDRLPLDLLK